jgi:hypothetical protein
MRWTAIVSAVTLLLFGIIPASADDVMLDVGGGAYSVNDFGGFSVAGTGLSIEATNDFCCGGFSDILPGQSYTESFTAASAPGALETFEGDLGNTFFTGNGWLTWEFSFVIPSSAPPGSVSEIQVPATVTGYVDFCSPATYEEVSFCGLGENPLGSGTITGAGTATAYLTYADGAYSSDQIYLDYDGTANIQTVPEPSTFVPFLGGLSLICYLKTRRRSSRLG